MRTLIRLRSLRRLARAAAFGALFILAAAPAAAQKAVFLVRHAEKVDDSDDAALSEAGLARARSLADWLRSAGVTAIYTTKFQRTRKTAEPLAQKLGLSPRVIASGDSQELVARLRTESANDIVLVVGHSNTLPEILQALGHPQPITISSQEYDNLFILIPHGGALPTLVRLRY